MPNYPAITVGPRAAHCTDGPFGRHPSLIVLHTAETLERDGTASSLNRWAAGEHGPAPRVSWHYAVDNGGIESSVPVQDIAWHAGHKPTNARSVGIEMAGVAAQSDAAWYDPYSLAVLNWASRLVAGLCVDYAIPGLRLSPDEVRAGMPGVCGHADVTKAFDVAGGHLDPGEHFPWRVFLGLVAIYING